MGGLWSLQYLSLAFYVSFFPERKKRDNSVWRDVQLIDGKMLNVMKRRWREKKIKKNTDKKIFAIPCAFKVRQRSLFTKIFMEEPCIYSEI